MHISRQRSVIVLNLNVELVLSTSSSNQTYLHFHIIHVSSNSPRGSDNNYYGVTWIEFVGRSKNKQQNTSNVIKHQWPLAAAMARRPVKMGLGGAMKISAAHTVAFVWQIQPVFLLTGTMITVSCHAAYCRSE